MLSLLLAAALTFSEANARSAYDLTRAFVFEHTPRDAGTLRGRLAANFILDHASSVGADVTLDSFETMTPSGKRMMTNLYASFGSDPKGEWTVIVSHYDTKAGSNSPGANDGGSTSCLLIELAAQLAANPPVKNNVMLVWTDGEECLRAYGVDDGFHGAKRAAERLVQQGCRVKAVIVLDMLGDRDLGISLPRNTSKALRQIALYAARRVGLANRVKEINELVKDDHIPFMDKGMKALVLIDFDYGSAPGKNDYWHSPADTPDKLSVSSFEASGKLVMEILNVLL